MSLIEGMKPRAEAGGPGKWSVDGIMSPRLLTISFLVPFVLSLVLSGAAIAQESTSTVSEEPDLTPEKAMDAQITRGITLFTNERMTEALSIFQKIIDRHKDDPKGYFYTAAVYGVTMADYKTREFEQEFNHFIELTIAKAESRLTVNNNDAEAQFYLGGAYGYRGIDKTLVGSWLGAFLDGTKGVFHLHKAVSYNPKFYDAY
jgi:tetratricopeptide (TPR) repeat protein